MKPYKTIKAGAQDDCEGCPLIPERREFLRNISAFAIAAISLSLPIRSISATVLSSAVGGRKTLSYPVPVADGADIDRDNEVILVRDKNEIYAFNLSCPHQNTALRWNESTMRFQCPKHHSQYQPDGEFITGRATRNMDRLAIRRDAANNIIVDPDTLYRSDEDVAEWKAAVVKV
jgi:nitrite reductase/ring-hydroxylating ferredoxin subunit